MELHRHSPVAHPPNPIPQECHSPAARCKGTNVVPKDCHSSTARSDAWTQLGSPRFILAPMVDASELPWRLLSRRYGSHLCYTPMVSAHQFIADKKLRQEILMSTPEDRPLIIQFCGNDSKNLTEAAKLAEPHCDGIDINIGCPQMVAKRGHYGAYLQDDWPLLTNLVSSLRQAVQVPVSCKIRIYQDVNKTVEYARMLERAGCQLLAVHGRTVDQRGMNTGLASWEHITAVRKALTIPVIANGNIQCLADVEACLAQTGVAGVMTAEGNLYNPALFTGQTRPAWELASEYLDLVAQYPVRLQYARGHVFNMCHHLLTLPENSDVRLLVGKTNHIKDLRKAVDMLRERFIDYHEGRKLWPPPNYPMSSNHHNLSLPPWICQPYVRPTPEQQEMKRKSRTTDGRKGERVILLPDLRRRENSKPKETLGETEKARAVHFCEKKCGNPRGLTCEHHLCRTCCKDFCVTGQRDCLAHKHYSSKATRIKHEIRAKKLTSTAAQNDVTLNGAQNNITLNGGQNGDITSSTVVQNDVILNGAQNDITLNGAQNVATTLNGDQNVDITPNGSESVDIALNGAQNCDSSKAVNNGDPILSNNIPKADRSMIETDCERLIDKVEIGSQRPQVTNEERGERVLLNELRPREKEAKL
ncbi:tRNA-dihydrouridine(16/17) synthase [NAD(P)(+)]-like isoform X4 [Diaphorina citri]|nr:tRNA-dihydrouridine(16/17) synthase [NAD(P)(+)]-like isoform X4 [Diaphorina citri]XP_026676558.1 tRNA-dihydrouridine(16/17) synthase [NAD(P)(+)]-like isoform X4 [Diaphorina citri]